MSLAASSSASTLSFVSTPKSVASLSPYTVKANAINSLTPPVANSASFRISLDCCVSHFDKSPAQLCLLSSYTRKNPYSNSMKVSAFGISSKEFEDDVSARFLLKEGVQKIGGFQGLKGSVKRLFSLPTETVSVVSTDDTDVEKAQARKESVLPSADLSQEQFSEQWSKSPRRICLFVEPSPFAYVCGYKNRFQNFIRNLRQMGDEVLVVTTHKGVPEDFHGAKVVPSWSFEFPFYKELPMSLALSPRILKAVADFKPDVIHSTSPGIMCFGALIVAKILSRPLVFSYHTHVPVYIPKYTFAFLVGPMWTLIRLLHNNADFTITTSHALGAELGAMNASSGEHSVGVWKKGIDYDLFHPKFRSDEMRRTLSGGEVHKPLIVHVGRLGAEKNLDLLKPVLERLPGARLAFVGDGPYRGELEKMFKGTPTVFTGMLQGDVLSAAYASADVFITPSESETLGFVVLEAMSSSVPVVAARAGGIPDIVSQDGVTGLLFSPGDVDDAVRKLKFLLDSPEARQRIGRAGRADAERFDWRSSTLSVRNEHYAVAVRSFLRKKRSKAPEWLPAWLGGKKGLREVEEGAFVPESNGGYSHGGNGSLTSVTVG